MNFFLLVAQRPAANCTPSKRDARDRSSAKGIPE
jgi:hypothetical protein